MSAIRRVAAAALALALGLAHAETAPPDAAARHARSLAASCNACHADRAAPGARMPSLAGRPEAELLAALRAYRASDRRGDVMVQLAKGYTDAQLAQIAGALAGSSSQDAP